MLRLWADQEGTSLAVVGDQPEEGLWVRAVESGGKLELLAVTFQAETPSDRAVTLQLSESCRSTAEISRIGAGSATLDETWEEPFVGGLLVLGLPTSLAALEIVTNVSVIDPRSKAAGDGQWVTAATSPRLGRSFRRAQTDFLEKQLAWLPELAGAVRAAAG